MVRLVAGRLAQTLLVLAGVTVVTFFMMHYAPGQPLQNNPELRLDPTAVERWLALRGLDKPVPAQYAAWLGRLLCGDMGVSLVYNRPVPELLRERIPATLLLTVTAFVFSFGLAVFLGTKAAARPGSLLDTVINAVSLGGVSLPGFWLCMLAVMVFSHRLNLLPGAGMATPGSGGMADVAAHLVLPVSVLSLSGFAHYVRYVRVTVMEVMSQDYVRTARAKGLRKNAILRRHVLPNAALPLVTVAALSLPFLFTGAAMVEYVFAWPGMGRFIITSTLARDYPVIMAANLLVAVLVALANLAADLVYMLLDPRLRVEHRYAGRR